MRTINITIQLLDTDTDPDATIRGALSKLSYRLATDEARIPHTVTMTGEGFYLKMDKVSVATRAKV